MTIAFASDGGDEVIETLGFECLSTPIRCAIDKRNLAQQTLLHNTRQTQQFNPLLLLSRPLYTLHD